MKKRFITIWFQHLVTDFLAIQDVGLKNKPFVITTTERNRIVVKEASKAAQNQGIYAGMAVADARAILADIHVLNEKPDFEEKLLKKLCRWCIRYTPTAAIQLPCDLVLDVTGCAHLWGGEMAYLTEITNRLSKAGFHIRTALADTIGMAWAVVHFGKNMQVVPSGSETETLLSLSPDALRLNPLITDRLRKLGLRKIENFISMPRPALRRRFGEEILKRIDQALGAEQEFIEPIIPLQPFTERLQCLEPIVTATGIEIAIQRLLASLCRRLTKEGKGLRTASLKAFRIDGKIEEICIGTNHPASDVNHLFKLFELKIQDIEPGLGIELFILEAPKVQLAVIRQQALWNDKAGLEDAEVVKLFDRIQNKVTDVVISRFLPDQHHWPEHSIKKADSLNQKPTIAWKIDRPRPIHLLPRPPVVKVTAPIPDYPPMMFRYEGKVHKVVRANGVERIEPEWWIEDGLHRDYYAVEDEDGKRYWLFRSGHYSETKKVQWFIHGFFA